MPVDYAKKKQPAQLSSLFTKETLRADERRNYYALGTVFPFVAKCADRSFGFVNRCDLTRVSMLYAETVNKMLLDYSGSAWVEDESWRLWLVDWKLKSTVEKVFGRYCSSGLFTLRVRLLNQLVDRLTRFRSLSFTDAGPFRHSSTVIKKYYSMTFWQRWN